MHFISAFIPTLLFASTVLAAQYQPYAGYKSWLVRRPGGYQPWFSSVSATLTLPQFYVMTCYDCGGGYLAITLGDPRIKACGAELEFGVLGFSVEAGVLFSCNYDPGTFNFRPYSRHPGGIKFMRPEQSEDFHFKVGDELEMRVYIQDGRAWVNFHNRVRGENSRHSGWEIRGLDILTVPKECLATAMWVMKAHLEPDGTLHKIPSFRKIIFTDLKAEDWMGRDVGYRVPDGVPSPFAPDAEGDVSGRMVMRDYGQGYYIASSFKDYEDDTGRSFYIKRELEGN